MPASCISSIVKVYDGKSGRVLPDFDPKMQKKLKHKRKSFASLVWHHVNRHKYRANRLRDAESEEAVR